MRRFCILILSVLLFLTICGCDKGMDTPDDLLKKAREEFSASEADEVVLAGQCMDAPTTLFWFMKNGHSHLLMECTKLDDGGYTFERSYRNPVKRADHIYINHWLQGTVFLINNPNCAAIQITDRSGTQQIPIEPGAYPFMYYCSLLPLEYQFLDADGNALS